MELRDDAPIVAVFGSTGDRPVAGRIGARLRHAGAIVLTGGTGPDDSAVKGAAIRGAGGTAGAWIGVARSPQAAPPTPPDASYVVVTPGWSHKRNFVEACLCDAAIALRGTTQGTASEVLFSYFLGRPVVLH